MIDLILENWRSKPLAVEALKGKAITKVAAGTGFSIFARYKHFVLSLKVPIKH